MSYWGSLSGHARVNVRNPDPFAVCDVCGFWYNKSKLAWQMQWAGKQIINRRLLVCLQCRDVPQSQLKTLTLPPDPMPLKDVRVEPFLLDEQDQISTDGTTVFTTEDGTAIYITDQSPQSSPDY